MTVDKTAITGKTLVTAAVGDHVLVADASDSDNLKRVTVQTIVDLATPPAAAGDFQVAVSDETTDLTTGTAKITFRALYAMTLTSVRASVNTVSSSGAVTVDVNKNGVSIFSTLLTIDASEKTSVTAATPAVLGTTAIADDDEITIDIDAAGTGAKGLKVGFKGTRA